MLLLLSLSLSRWVIDEAGVNASSASYRMRGSLSQSVIGETRSENYVLYIGYWRPQWGGPQGIRNKWGKVIQKIPVETRIYRVFPNPFISSLNIIYGLGSPQENVCIKIYDNLGREIYTQEFSSQKSGFYHIKWKGIDKNGKKIPPGVYFLHFKAGRCEDKRKIIFLH